MYAVLGNQPKMCDMLLGMGAAVNAKDSTGLTALLWAAYQAKPQVLRTLLRSVDRSTLSLVSRFCSLLRHGADVNICDREGRSVFHWAVKTPNIQCLKTLCKYANGNTVNTVVSVCIRIQHCQPQASAHTFFSSG